MTKSSDCCSKVCIWFNLIGLTFILTATTIRFFYEPVYLGTTELNARYKDQVNDLHYVIVQQGKLNPTDSRKADASDAQVEQDISTSAGSLSNLCLGLFSVGSVLLILSKAKKSLGGSSSCCKEEAPTQSA